MFSQHVTRNISAYHHGELTVEESRQVTEHVIACAKCRAQFDEIRLGIRLAEQLPYIAASENLWQDLEPKLGKVSSQKSSKAGFFWRVWPLQTAVSAAVLLLVVALGFWWIRQERVPVSRAAAGWAVQRVDGTIRIGSVTIENDGQLGVGQWLETDGNSKAQIAVSSIGQVEIGSDTRIRLLQTQPNEHRIELARGKLSARIWAPPRLFFVDTPSAVAADLGCAYTLEVDDKGASLLRVTSGWVALQLKDRESMVPAGAACETRPGIGPGTPYFEDAAPEFRQSLTKIDFDTDSASKKSALEVMLSHTRKRDTLTLWHLLSRVEGDERGKVYEKIATFVPPPVGVTRDGILLLDQKMLEIWREQLELSWADSTIVPKAVAEAYWRVKNGVQRRTNKLK